MATTPPERPFYDADLAKARGFVDHDLEPLPQDPPIKGEPEEEECQFHSNDKPGKRNFRKIQLTMLPGKPWACGSCLMDLVRDGRIVPIPTQVYIDHVLNADVVDDDAALRADGSVAMGGMAFSWGG